MSVRSERLFMRVERHGKKHAEYAIGNAKRLRALCEVKNLFA